MILPRVVAQRREHGLRLACRDDARDLAILEELIFYRPDEQSFKWKAEDFAAAIDHPDRAVLVTTVNAAAVGFAVVDLTRPAYLANIGVLTQWRGAGKGSDLVKVCEGMAHLAGCKTMTLHTAINERNGPEVFARMGYQRVSEIPDFYGPGTIAVFMRKTLSATS